MNYRQDKLKPLNHDVFNVWGSAGEDLLAQRVVGKLYEDYPSDIVVIGSEDELTSFREKIERHIPKDHWDKLQHRIKILNWDSAKTRLDGSPVPFSLNSRRAAEHIAFMVNSGLRVQGQEKQELDIGTVVVLDGETEWLDYLLKKIREQPLTVYVCEWGVVSPAGIFVRQGYEHHEERPVEETFTALCSWKLPPFTEIVSDILVLGGVHVWAGLFESYKSMAGLELSAAILQGRPAFDHFPVAREYVGSEILYLCLDMPHGLFLSYASNFGLPGDARFMANAPGVPSNFEADTPVLREAVQGRILFIDTMLDVAGIRDAFQSAEWVEFFKKIRALINECGCLAVVLIAHPTKSGARNSVIDATEYLKDSVTFGGKIDVAFAFRKVSDREVHVERIKGRGFERPIKFSLATHDESGKSWISQGRFPVCVTPDEGIPLAEKLNRANAKPFGPLKNLSADLIEKLKDCRKRGMGPRDAARELGENHSNVIRWWKAIDEKVQQDEMF